MTVDVASLALRVDALEVNAASESLKRLQKSGGDAETSLGSSMDAITAGFGRAAAQIGVLYGAFQTLSGASREFLNFDKSLALISTQLGDATDRVIEFDAASRDLAKRFGTKLTDQTGAFYEILSAGITDAAQATTLLAEANKLAIGGNARLQVVIDGLTSIMKGYGDKVTDVTAVSDAFFTAALAGKTTIEELAEGLGRVVPLAEVLDVSFDQLSASVAALTLSGISTREAITGVRAVLAAVVKPSSEAATEAERLGLQFNSAALKAKGFQAFLEDVKQKTGGSSDSLSLLFGGVEALLPALALTGNAGKEFNGIMEQMSDKTGIADKSFEKMTNTHQGKLDRFFAAVNNAAVTLGGTLAGVLAPAAEAAASALNALFTTKQLDGIQQQKNLISDLTSKLERMKGINNVLPFDGIIFNKKEFDEVEFRLEVAKQDLEDMIKLKEEAAKPIEKIAETPLVPNDPPKGGNGGGGKGSGRKEAIDESQRFITSLQQEARESGVTGLALLELRAKYLGVSAEAEQYIDVLRRKEAADIAQRDIQAQYARDLDRVKQLTNEVATAEEIFISKQEELVRLMSTGMLDPGTFFRQIEKAGDEMRKTVRGGNDDMKNLEFAIQGWGRAATDALIDFSISGKGSFSDFATSVLKDIARMYVQMQLITPLLQSLPGLGFGGASGGTAAATSSAASSVFSNLFKGFGRATGGPVSSRSMTRVNELGPELLSVGGKDFLMMGNQGGNITPNKSLSGSSTSSSNIIVNVIEAPGKGGQTNQRQTPNGVEIDVMVDELVAKKQAQRSSMSNKGLRQNFGLSDNLVMR